MAFAIGISARAQETDSTRLRLSGYVDAYYSYFSDSLGPNALQQFTTVSPRSERFGLNVAQVGAHYEGGRIRGNVTLHYGDIAKATWSAEFNPVQEANVGLRIKPGWWLDGGFFTTHIGTESFLPKNNYLSSTAVATYNEPFYQAGARLSYEGSEQFHAEFWLANGYNFFLDANSAKSVGLLLRYRFSDQTSLTYTSLFGRESPDGAAPEQLRLYQNLYLNTSLGGKLFLALGGDLGLQSNFRRADGGESALMYNALAVARFQFTPAFSATARGEVFQDPEGFISGAYLDSKGEEQGLQLWGITLGAEFRPVENAYLRVEGRYLRADEELAIFTDGPSANARWETMATLGFYFDHPITAKKP